MSKLLEWMKEKCDFIDIRVERDFITVRAITESITFTVVRSKVVVAILSRIEVSRSKLSWEDLAIIELERKINAESSDSSTSQR